MEILDALLLLVQGVGSLVVLSYVVTLVTFIYSRFFKAPLNPRSFGKWVIVTGATDGIGKALCFEFAKKGMDVVLISRTLSKLEEVSSEIKQKFPKVTTKALAVDFSQLNEKIIEELTKEINALDDVGVLVNNVGQSYEFPQYFHELSDDEVNSLLQLNIHATTAMTRMVIPIFMRQKRGAIINIGSFAGIYPSPLLALYSASKSYVEKLSYSLYEEYRPFGVHVECHVPLYIVSKMSKFKRSTFFIPSSEDYARKVIAQLGKFPIVSGHLPQSLFTGVTGMLPLSMMLQQVRKMHLSIRSKGLKKREQIAEAKKKS